MSVPCAGGSTLQVGTATNTGTLTVVNGNVSLGGNTLMKLAPVRAHDLRFDVNLGRTGGEDTSFFHALGRLGATMIVTDDAQVREEAPASRVNVRYFRHRAIRTGQIYARFVTGTADPGMLARLRFYSGAMVKAAVALGIGAAIYPFDKARALRLAMPGWMNVGKLREMLRLAPAHMI